MSFDVPGFTPDPARHARLIQLSPAEAARALLDGEFTIGDEPPLCFALRKDPRITLDDDAILEVFFEMMDEGADLDERFPGDHISADAFLDRLAAATPPGTTGRSAEPAPASRS